MRLLAQVKNDLDGLVRDADTRLFSGPCTSPPVPATTAPAAAAAAAYASYDDEEEEEEEEDDDDDGECGPPLPRPYVPTTTAPAAAAASSPAPAARGARLSTGSNGTTAVQWTKGLWSPLLASSRPASAEEGEVEGEEDGDGGYDDTGAGAPLPAAATTAAATKRHKQKRRQSWPSPLRSSSSSHSSPLAAAGATPPPAGAAAAATTTSTTSPLLAKGQALPPIEALCGPAAARALAAEERALSLVFSRWVGGWVGGRVGLWGGARRWIDVTSVWSCDLFTPTLHSYMHPPDGSYAHGSSRASATGATGAAADINDDDGPLPFLLRYEDMEALLLDLGVVPRLLSGAAVRRLSAQVIFFYLDLKRAQIYHIIFL